MSVDLSTAGRRIRFLRESRGWSQDTLAKMVYVTKMAISHWESGDRTPSRHSQKLLAEVLGTTREFLFGDKAA